MGGGALTATVTAPHCRSHRNSHCQPWYQHQLSTTSTYPHMWLARYHVGLPQARTMLQAWRSRGRVPQCSIVPRTGARPVKRRQANTTPTITRDQHMCTRIYAHDHIRSRSRSRTLTITYAHDHIHSRSHTLTITYTYDHLSSRSHELTVT